jgi:hypothetical protein
MVERNGTAVVVVFVEGNGTTKNRDRRELDVERIGEAVYSPRIVRESTCADSLDRCLVSVMTMSSVLETMANMT